MRDFIDFAYVTVLKVRVLVVFPLCAAALSKCSNYFSASFGSLLAWLLEIYTLTLSSTETYMKF